MQRKNHNKNYDALEKNSVLKAHYSLNLHEIVHDKHCKYYISDTKLHETEANPSSNEVNEDDASDQFEKDIQEKLRSSYVLSLCSLTVSVYFYSFVSYFVKCSLLQNSIYLFCIYAATYKVFNWANKKYPQECEIRYYTNTLLIGIYQCLIQYFLTKFLIYLYSQLIDSNTHYKTT